MKKYLNKGLLYEWFNAAKAPILIGLITWGYFAKRMLTWGLADVRNEIGSAQTNGFSAVDLNEYSILGFIFMAIYIFACGVSKRNTTMFLCSGPYTKKQIKINELICLLITLVLFIVMFLYIVATVYIRNSELMFIVIGYPQIILIEVIRLLLFGTIGILLMITIDLLFSNSIMSFFGIAGLIIATMCILGKAAAILNYFGAYSRIMDNIFGRIVNDNLHRTNILFFAGRYRNDQLWLIFKGIIFLLVIIAIMLFIFNIAEKRAKLETSNKIFSCKTNENIIVSYLSLGIGAFVSIIASDIISRNGIHGVRRMVSLSSSDIVRLLTIDVIIIAIITFISYKIIKKVLKTIG